MNLVAVRLINHTRVYASRCLFNELGLLLWLVLQSKLGAICTARIVEFLNFVSNSGTPHVTVLLIVLQLLLLGI
jgi:hypothetical protein